MEYYASHEVWKGVNGDEAEMYFQSINLATGFQLSLKRPRELGQRYGLLNLRHNSPVNVSHTSESDDENDTQTSTATRKLSMHVSRFLLPQSPHVHNCRWKTKPRKRRWSGVGPLSSVNTRMHSSIYILACLPASCSASFCLPSESSRHLLSARLISAWIESTQLNVCISSPTTHNTLLDTDALHSTYTTINSSCRKWRNSTTLKRTGLPSVSRSSR